MERGDGEVWGFETSVSGDRAKAYKVIKNDDYTDVLGPRDELQSANSVDGTFSYKDAAGQTVEKTLGPHSIRIVPKR